VAQAELVVAFCRFDALGPTVTDHRSEDAGRTDDRTRAHVFVSGRVQGVFYRATTRDTARERGVDGWVRNLDDGRVEAVFEGPTEPVESMVEWSHEGSPAAAVEDVSVEYGNPEGLDGFEIRR
jgi:acylphosphatase